MAGAWIGRDHCAIVGIGSTGFSHCSGRSALTLAVEASLTALDDAGIDVDAVDAVLRCDQDEVLHNDLAHSLGISDLAYFGSSGPGGVAPCSLVGQAVGAIMSGQASTVLIFRSLNGRSGPRPGRALYSGDSDEIATVGGDGSYAEYFAPYGLVTPPQVYALIARRHMIQHGTTQEQLGEIALTCRRRAIANPGAQMRTPLTLDDYLSARIVADPLRLYDCCVETDGACAIVVTDAERARDCRQRPALVAGVAHGSGPRPQGGVLLPSLLREDITASSSRFVAETLYRRAGIGPDEVDVAQLYDCFTVSALLQLADFGFCKPDEAGAFVQSGAIELGGSLPINTAGGHLSEGYIHGLNHVVEAVRQVRGTSSSQVPGAEVSLATSGPPIATGAVLLRGA
jgi:acetyl-CoA acetyltransferase